MKKPELLSPAGDFERLQYALAYGADAVYLAGKDFGMRTASDNFSQAELCRAVTLAHGMGKRIFVTVNTMPRNGEMERLPPYLEQLEDAGVDAAIIADLGVLRLCQRYAPHVAPHISTQANVTNYQAARAWHELGARRIVLARELSLEEVAAIRAKTPAALELEVFVHGAMCMSYSGRCYLSAYLTGRDANRGNCAQPCRWKYSLVEQTRPGMAMPVYEDGQGAYILNSKDLCMIDHIPDLVQAGVDSLKIEGRMKTAYYTAVTTNAYRRAIDLYAKDPAGYELPAWIAAEVEKVSHREYYTGFFFGGKGEQRVQDGGYLRTWDVCAMSDGADAPAGAIFTQKNKFAPGDRLELVTPQAPPQPLVLERLLDQEGNALDSAPHPHQKVIVPQLRQVGPLAMLRRERPREE